ncbi:hypothetical protein [Flavisolibacter tropicus]|uniref:Uncharacterized protein n=1 Tax=Flavisolibacter tropicus TaxID=1492898 RepID=A0A172TVJ7_9BACT|nr:hypothetical protein [Flavisolibacter tropicus]ANE50904.1 hypothetical protein SY85_10710 [Flavisolibacter tropicus]
MKSLAFYILLLFIVSCKNTSKQTLHEFASAAFFKADLDKSFEKLVNYFQSQPILKYNEPEGDNILYPPLSGLGDTSDGYRFSIATHPYMSALNGRGQLVVNRLGPILAEPELVYYFKSHENALNFIKRITNAIQEQPIIDSSSQKGKSREIQYQLDNGANIQMSLSAGLNPGYILSIKYKPSTSKLVNKG